MSENSILSKLADRLKEWDGELDQLRKKAESATAENKQKFEQMAEEVRQQTAAVRAKVEEYRHKSADEIKAEVQTELDELLKKTSGRISEGLTKLSRFFEERSGGSGSA
ncbi:MAG: hypothetical protein KDK35_02165 [Leptospiraceae bacterium]|nr:hypothetical protein [Leptospiraceae bacterium]MCP5485613.1 hypothetical protein [Spirochaetales bacterium]